MPPTQESSTEPPPLWPDAGPISLAIDFAAYSVVRMLVAVIGTLPVDMGDSMCRFIAWLAAGPLSIRKKQTDHNLDLIFPSATADQRKRLTFAMWHHLLLMVCEIAWAQRRLHLSNWHEHVTFRNNKQMLRYMLSDRPMVMVTGHFGNFEIGGYTSGLMGINTLAIARRLDNRFLHRWVEQFRSAKGQLMVDKVGCAQRVDRHLADGGILSLLADQHAGEKGCWVDFMGAPASCHKALALFSLTQQAPMVVVSTRRVGGKPMQFEASCIAIADPEIDTEICSGMKSLTQWYNAQLAEAVAEAPEQYWWLHRRWRKPPAKVAKRLAKAAA
ncbi:Lipid A biosynthesis lauroyl acyltransferase [Rubripirellula obstinata]|uniref:Lipid A biosynthesis lauroyl acyltransferase n=1 Tax=Rubripirellula obstinata TaxID=406547 RepID=A0A5B1CJ94_9BACT|nr:lysophospholipid acyltransferase family protein [Rubripirellula obstinata]KAA1259523.1 Lipid A biosynthesis lauroyl acyltransferase [Rubripirellula obstinata]